ncbi:MAG: hypothetical protein ACFFKA_10905 [Candidatus Thorarchaeota archaeon]
MGESVSIDVDGMSVGTYVCICTTYLAGFSSSKAVLVIVYGDTPSNLELDPWLLMTMISFGGLVLMAVALILMWRKYRRLLN